MEMQTILDKSKSDAKNTIKNARKKKKRIAVKNKNMHGQFMTTLDEPHVDLYASTAWLRSSTLKRATEATICAIQEQAITTKYIRKNVHHTTNDDSCRACKNSPETIHHVISSCPVLAPTKYKNDEVKILWNFPVRTDRTVAHNKPDIIVHEKVKKNVFLIDIAVPNDRNIARKRAEKLRNYHDLSFEVKQLWNVNTVKIVPVIIGATGVIHQDFDKKIHETLDININVTEAQKIVLLGTANINRYFFSTEF